MYACPACGAEGVAGRAACECGADLSLLQSLDGVADAWFNEALKALGEGRTGRALEWLSACCAARGTDARARLAQAKVWAQLGRWGEAMDALERAREMDAELPEALDLEQALKDAMAGAAAAKGVGAARLSEGAWRARRARARRGARRRDPRRRR